MYKHTLDSNNLRSLDCVNATLALQQQLPFLCTLLCQNLFDLSTTSSTIHVREASKLCVLPQWYSVVQEPPRYCWVLRRCISKLCLPSVLWIFPFVYHGLWVFIVPLSFCSTCIMVWCANLISHYSVSTNLTLFKVVVRASPSSNWF